MIWWAMPLSLTVGMFQILTAFCILAKEVVLSPCVPNYPTATKRLRCSLFLFGCAMAYFGAETLEMAMAHYRFSRPSSLVVSASMFSVFYFELEKVLRQWLPERLQRRVARLWSLASCASAREVRLRRDIDMNAVPARHRTRSPSPKTVAATLVELEMQGVQVIGPNEGSEAFE